MTKEKILFIVESPAKAKTINKYLGKQATVIASYGHVRALIPKKGSVLPEEDFSMKYENINNKQIGEILKHVNQNDLIYLATDPDREGEAISWHIYEIIAQKYPSLLSKIYRVSFNEITKNAIFQAIDNRRQIDMSLVNAQQARSALDYLVGFNLSPILWRKLPGSKSAGRVQSVALRIICEREDERDKFISEEYWKIEGLFENKTISAALKMYENKKLDKLSIPNEETSQKIVEFAKNFEYEIAKVEKSIKSRRPYAPFNTSSLQQDAFNKLGFSAKKTMTIAQKLYEGVVLQNGESTGLITYMRTDGVTIGNDVINDIRNMIPKKYGKDYLSPKVNIYKTKSKNAQEAHEAIRPTNIHHFPENLGSILSKDEMALYRLIWNRTVASQMSNVQFETVGIDIENIRENEFDRISFHTTGSVLIFDGFYKLYEYQHDDKIFDKSMIEGKGMDLNELIPTQHFTQPPARYTEASLVKKLEEYGIGRPSTYATIISVLQAREYVQIQNKAFVANLRGRLVTALLKNYFAQYVEYDFTAGLENQLDDIASGDIQHLTMLHNFWNNFDTTVQDVATTDAAIVVQKIEENLEHIIHGPEKTEKICPKCQSVLSLRVSKFGCFFGCPGYPDCEHLEKIYYDIINEEENSHDGAGDIPKEGIELGNTEDNNQIILLKKGPYGLYLELSENDNNSAKQLQDEESIKGKKKKSTKAKKPKRIGIPKNIPSHDITLEFARQMIALPREIGIHPVTNEPIKSSFGPYGPYLVHNGKYTSLKESEEVFNVSVEEAINIITLAEEKRKNKKPRASKKSTNKDTSKAKTKTSKAKTSSKEASRGSSKDESKKSSSKKSTGKIRIKMK